MTIERTSRVLVFAKAPVAGTVKTRLLPLLNPEAAAALHRRLVCNALSAAVGSGIGAVELWCAPTATHPFFSRCARDYGVSLREQVTGDLGARMQAAFEEALAMVDQAICVGTDCPSLGWHDLQIAESHLAKAQDAVIIPAEDGGYVLLGLRRFAPQLFRDIRWGSNTVLDQTRERFEELAWRWKELAPKWDLDRPEDYLRMVKEGWLARLPND